MIDWNLQSRARECQSCQHPFAHKEVFHTLLFDQKHGYERLDVCGTCWTSQHSQGAADRKGYISHWQGFFIVPPAHPPDAIQKETAETLLRKLVLENDPKHLAARFILAVMLERKRMLKVKAQVVEDQQRIFLYEDPLTGDLLKIIDPNLRLDQLEEVQRDISELLGGGSHESTPAPVAQTDEPQAGPVLEPSVENSMA